MAGCVAVVGLGDARIGLIAIVVFGIPNAVYNAVMPAWCMASRTGRSKLQTSSESMMTISF